MIENPKFKKGQRVVISSYQQITDSGAKAMVDLGRTNIARTLQKMGNDDLQFHKLHVGSIGTVTQNFIDGWSTVDFGKGKRGERVLDMPQEAIEVLSKKTFFSLVLPGFFGLK